jgi:CBS domain containing-hemolysin-like protein
MRMVEESGETGIPRKIKKKLNIIKYLFGKKDKTSLSDTIVDFVEDNDSEKIGVEEKEILLNAVNFTDTLVEDVMVPRSDIVAINIESDLPSIKKSFSYQKIH